MSYDKSLMAKAIEEMEHKRESREKLINHLTNDIYNKIPRIREIDYMLSNIGCSLVKNIILNKESDSDAIIETVKNKTFSLKAEKVELLVKNGFPADYLDIKYQCDICKDNGYLGSKRCKCFDMLLAVLAYKDSNLSENLDKQTFEGFDFNYYSDEVYKSMGKSPRENIENVFRQCLNFVSNFESIETGLFLNGGTGLGKTYLSTAIAKELLDKQVQVYYQTAAKMFKILSDNQFNNLSNDKLLVSKLYSAELLIIDDLGTEFKNSYTVSALFELLNSRILEKKKTIINTNMNIKEISIAYSDRVSSRILEHFKILTFFGEDIRKQKALR